MADYLVIVESPGKVKAIGKFLGPNYKIQASIGHVRDLPKSQMGVDIENDFEPRYITIRGKADIINRLKKEAKNSRRVYLATDPDREGEAISWHLANLLNLDKSEKCRITFNEITKNAVKNAVKSPRSIDMNLVDAQQARRILDRIVGYMISPILWKKVKKGLSAGRVQSVATRLICDREEEIEGFVPVEYWIITAFLSKFKSKSAFTARFYGTVNEKMELADEQQVNGVLKELEGCSYKILKIKKSEKRKSPAPPFITSTMQQEAARKLGFTTKRTMMVAQQLYEGIDVKDSGTVGLITYMRTDSTRVASEAQIETRKYIQGKYGEKYLPDEIRNYKNRSASQDAHEAIRPTYMSMEPDSIKSSLNSEQYRLYKLIWDRFIASQMASAVYDTLAVDVAASRYIFKANGSKVKFPGFIVAYIEGRDEEIEDDEINLPELAEGEELNLKKIEPKQHFTQPPQRYTEAALVKTLEEKGIGRPSTYSTIISTILARGYIQKEGKFLLPTSLSKVVTDIMKNFFKDIVDVQFTAQMEKKLDDVEEGDKKWVELMREFYSPFVGILKAAEEQISHVTVPDEVTDIICEKCGKNMVVKNGRYGRFLACPGFPECRNTRPILEEAGVKCPRCGGRVLFRKTKKGRKYLGCENNPSCSFMTWDKPVKENCPKCGNFVVKKFSGRKSHLKCSSENCDYTKEA